MKDIKGIIMHIVFLIAACVSILAVALICIFLFANGLPAIVMMPNMGRQNCHNTCDGLPTVRSLFIAKILLYTLGTLIGVMMCDKKAHPVYDILVKVKLCEHFPCRLRT